MPTRAVWWSDSNIRYLKRRSGVRMFEPFSTTIHPGYEHAGRDDGWSASGNSPAWYAVMEKRGFLIDTPLPVARRLSQQRGWLAAALLGFAGAVINANWAWHAGGVALALGSFLAYFAVRIFSPAQMAVALAISTAGALGQWHQAFAAAALAILTLEGLALPVMLKRHAKWSPVHLDLLFWLTIGMPLAWLATTFVPDLTTTGQLAIVLKLAICAVLGVTIGELLYGGLLIGSGKKLREYLPSISIDSAVLSLLMLGAAIPTSFWLEVVADQHSAVLPAFFSFAAAGMVAGDRAAELYGLTSFGLGIVLVAVLAAVISLPVSRLAARISDTLADLQEAEPAKPHSASELDRMFALLDGLDHQMQSQRQRLLNKRRRIQVIIEHGGLVLYSIDPRRPREISSITPNVMQMLGYSEEEVMQPGWLFKHLHREDRRKPPMYTGDFNDQKSHTGEYRLRHKDGHYVWVHDCVVAGEPGKAGQDEYIGFVLDITDRKAAAERLLQAGKLESLGRVAAGVAHELNQPLNFIKLAGHNMLRRLSDGTFEEAMIAKKLDQILHQVDRAASIVQHVRTFGQRSPIRSEVIAIGEVFTPVEELLKGQLTRSDVTLTYGPYDAGLQVMIDPMRLEQVLINLIVNARDSIVERQKTSPGAGEIVITTQPRGNTVQIIVEDNGRGIDSSKIGILFEPFYTTKSPQEGTGLGLSVSYGILAEAGGSIHAENTHKGARFVIQLPLIQPKPAVA